MHDDLLRAELGQPQVSYVCESFDASLFSRALPSRSDSFRSFALSPIHLALGILPPHSEFLHLSLFFSPTGIEADSPSPGQLETTFASSPLRPLALIYRLYAPHDSRSLWPPSHHLPACYFPVKKSDGPKFPSHALSSANDYVVSPLSPPFPLTTTPFSLPL